MQRIYLLFFLAITSYFLWSFALCVNTEYYEELPQEDFGKNQVTTTSTETSSTSSYIRLTTFLEKCEALNTNVQWEFVPLTQLNTLVEPGAVYDPTSKKIFLFGGANTFVIDVSNLTEAQNTVTISDITSEIGKIDSSFDNVNQADGAFFFTDANENTEILTFSPFLEGTFPNVLGSDEVYSISTNNINDGWEIVDVSGSPPSSRSDYGLAYIPENNYYYSNSVFIFGGHDIQRSMKCIGDFYNLNLNEKTASWSEIDVTGGPSPRAAAQLSFNWSNNSIILFGGRYADNTLDAANSSTWVRYKDVWEFPLETEEWNELIPSGTAPPALDEYSMCQIDPCRLLIAGGYVNTDEISNQFYLLNLFENKWEPAPIADEMTDLWGEFMYYDQERKVLFITNFIADTTKGTSGIWIGTGF